MTESFGVLLRRHRLRRKLTQEALSERTGISVRSIGAMERLDRARGPRPQTIAALADALDLDAVERELFTDAGRKLFWAARAPVEATPLEATPVQAAAVEATLVGARPADGDASVPATPPGRAADPSPPTCGLVPRQLPAAVPGFVGRSAELDTLDAVLGNERDGLGVVVLSGTAGVGKSTLATHWAHRARFRFPDGELYVNLRGYDAEAPPMDPYAAVRGFLDALGVAGTAIPPEHDGQVNLYRSLLADRRMLIVVDNARNAAQVLPLLPGAAGCRVLVTSRDRLEPLVVQTAAVSLPLALLSTEESRQLLGERLGTARVAEERDAVDQIIESCARLPLALAITASRAAVRPGYPLRALARDLTAAAGALDALSVGATQVDVRSVLSWSYRLLDAGTARLFRQLSLHPGPDVELTAVASLARVTPHTARGMLRELTCRHLLDEPEPDRYAFHDLLRGYAAERATAQDSPAETALAHRRLLDHYLLTARAAALLIAPRVQPSPPQAADGVLVAALLDSDAALAWFRRERVVLANTIDQAGRHGFDAHAWQLAQALGRFFERQGDAFEWLAIQQAGLAAAERLGDPRATACCLTSLGVCYGSLHDHSRAARHLLRAIDLLGTSGEPGDLPSAHHNLSIVLTELGRPQEALAHSRSARRLYAAMRDHRGVSTSLNTTAEIHLRLGNAGWALRYGGRALALAVAHGFTTMCAYVWDTLGSAHRQLGDIEQAVRCYERAIETGRRSNDWYVQAWALQHLAEVLHSAAPQTANAARQQAIKILDELRHPVADKIRARAIEA